MRAFLAVPVEEPALAEVRALLSSLREQIGGVRWTSDDSLHITVHFFGSVSGEDALRAVSLLRHIVSDTSSFAVTLDMLGEFPPRGGPRVLWAGPSGQVDSLDTFARATREALREDGFGVDERPFRPHCTLGRPRERWPAHSRDAWRRIAGGAFNAQFDATRLVLYESITKSSGAVHVPRMELPFTTS
ncbi:MAG: RNA 2',3'-cyclic phosphodiesterase [Candidatus Dormibacteraeota bacterium]|nr:RNA 2',3'-cyclic phosphodiesterase [Candidatus Dormibacteraeota bacterium]